MGFSRQGCRSRLPFPSFALFPRACGVLCVLFKSEVFIYLSPVGFPKLSPAGFQNQMLWRLIFLMQEPQGGEPAVRFRTLIPIVSLCNAIILEVCVYVAHLGYVIWLYHEPIPPTHLTVVPSLCLCVCVLSRFSHVWLFLTLWTAYQDPLSMGFSRQEYWSGLPCQPPGYLLAPGVEPRFVAPELLVDSLLVSHQWSPCFVSLAVHFSPIGPGLFHQWLFCK